MPSIAYDGAKDGAEKTVGRLQHLASELVNAFDNINHRVLRTDIIADNIMGELPSDATTNVEDPIQSLSIDVIALYIDKLNHISNNLHDTNNRLSEL